MIKVIKVKLTEMIKKKGYEAIPYRVLAEKIGVDHVSLWKLANGKNYNPSLSMLDKLCAFFKCQPGDILEFRKD